MGRIKGKKGIKMAYNAFFRAWVDDKDHIQHKFQSDGEKTLDQVFELLESMNLDSANRKFDYDVEIYKGHNFLKAFWVKDYYEKGVEIEGKIYGGQKRVVSGNEKSKIIQQKILSFYDDKIEHYDGRILNRYEFLIDEIQSMKKRFGEYKGLAMIVTGGMLYAYTDDIRKFYIENNLVNGKQAEKMGNDEIGKKYEKDFVRELENIGNNPRGGGKNFIYEDFMKSKSDGINEEVKTLECYEHKEIVNRGNKEEDLKEYLEKKYRYIGQKEMQIESVYCIDGIEKSKYRKKNNGQFMYTEEDVNKNHFEAWIFKTDFNEKTIANFVEQYKNKIIVREVKQYKKSKDNKIGEIKKKKTVVNRKKY
jgi:hypothetical protein